MYKNLKLKKKEEKKRSCAVEGVLFKWLDHHVLGDTVIPGP
jgi:hypothetical protein